MRTIAFRSRAISPWNAKRVRTQAEGRVRTVSTGVKTITAYTRPVMDGTIEAVLDEPAMSAWAERLGAVLRGGDVVLLRGPMGAGKTTLTRALARGLGVFRPERVCSPTYTVCMIHPSPVGPSSHGNPSLVHLDLFRLGENGPVGSAAFEALGLEHDELPGPTRVLVVEWSELWLDPPQERLQISLARTPDDRRAVRVEGFGERWSEASLPAPSG
jgi:tRNA threonylcarbamoyladenosine biosynthesis protein TsaE